MPERLGRYRITAQLGKGSFGAVYQGYDEELRREVAIKVPHRQLLAVAEDADAFVSEGRTLAGLDHPGIVPIYDVGRTQDGVCYLVSKFIDGCDLAQTLRQSRPGHAEAVAIVVRVAEALHHAHQLGLVHRDIKPANILNNVAGYPVVADFGLALREEDWGKEPGIGGTPAYMSPEQARGEGHRVDARTDVYSLGVVFYELLTGRRPFPGPTIREMLEQIQTWEPRPPRQLDGTIPQELDRICLKCLAKRASERYSTALDLAEDLRHWQAGLRHEPASEGIGAAGPDWVNGPPQVIPRGLRCFDVEDAPFFLSLLPGPRDRDGLPDTIRFWKTRIETMDADDTFAVGLIYGPSGCGKTSLVKAGLLPRLAKTVTTVYIESTAEETEARLLKGLRRQVPDLPGNLGLVESLAAVRRGRFLASGRKVLLVLDQFEQWLHARRNEDNTELVQALRQCDGGRLQGVVMVRDDFWMAVTRFMRGLEISLLEGQNSAAVDLFPIRHAEKVLAAFGRAFGELPLNSSDETKEQRQFIEQSVAGLAQDGKANPVRLALLAEMVKGKSWRPATLKEVGGAEGLGISFLEETFTASTAPPQHRLHQKAAQAVLKSLLPEAGTDIKGHMRSQQELLHASGYSNRTQDFDELIRILDSEIRLITPTDPEGKDDIQTRSVSEGNAEPSLTLRANVGIRYYQLTHDYLVPSLRDWLTRKQKETRQGRAGLLLADRAAVWHARQENRQLPSLLQWCQIRWWTPKKNWTPPQRKMMGKAARYHAVRGAAAVFILAVVTFTGLAIAEQIEQRRKETYAAGLVQSLLNADTAQVPALIGELTEYRQWADPLLREENDKAAATSLQKLHTSLALLPVDSAQVDYLYGRLLEAQPQQVPVIREALAPHQDALRDKLWAVVERPDPGRQHQTLRAASALASYDAKSPRWAKVQTAVANDLVAVPAVHLKAWMDALRGAAPKLQDPLATIYRETGRRETERSLATDVLADYVADQPQALAELVMDADEKQFAVLFAKLESHGESALPWLLIEVDKTPLIGAREVVKREGTIKEDDAKVSISNGKRLPAKSYDEVPLQAGKKYFITMDSKDVDSFLVLQDKNSREELDFHDGGGQPLNAYRIYMASKYGARKPDRFDRPNCLLAFLVYTATKNDTCRIYAASSKGTGSFLLTVVELVGEDAKEKQAKRQANAAVALLRMDQAAKVWPLLKHSGDPRLRSYLIHRLGPMRADVRVILKRLEDEPAVTIQRALTLSLGEFGEKDLPAADRKPVVASLQELFRTANDPGLHGAAEWILRHWKEDEWLKKEVMEWAQNKEQKEKRFEYIKQELTKEKGQAQPQWYITGQGQTMVVIPGPVKFMMGSLPPEKGRNSDELQHRKKISRSFAIAAQAVTSKQFRAFLPTHTHATMRRAADPSRPVGSVTWFEAAAYCNWLSKQEGIDQDQWCYETTTQGVVTQLKKKYLSLTGYRLPTEAELEYAARAGAVTSRYYGETEELLPHYAWYVKNSSEDRTRPVGGKKPNDLGLFDMHGNLWCWCQDREQPYQKYKPSPEGQGYGPVEDIEDDEDFLLSITTERRVVRGGSYYTQALSMRSAKRMYNRPADRSPDIGIRVARTLPLVPLTPLPPSPEGGRK